MIKKIVFTLILVVFCVFLVIYFNKQKAQEQISPEQLSASQTQMNISLVPIRLEENVVISSAMSKEVLKKVNFVSGWSSFENWGVWSDAKEAVIEVNVEKLPRNFKIQLSYLGFVNEKYPRELYKIFNVNGEFLAECFFDGQDNLNQTTKLVTVDIDKQRDQGGKLGYISLVIQIPDASSPKETGFGKDSRVLGFGLKNLKILP